MRKKNILLVVPLLDQGGLERICALTAQLLKEETNVAIALFNSEGMIYDVSGIPLYDLELGSVPSKFGKVIQLLKRVKKLRKIRKEFQADISFSFGTTANLANIFSKTKGRTWCGIHSYGSVNDKNSMRFICRLSDRVIACSQVIGNDLLKKYSLKKVDILYNMCDVSMIEEQMQQPVLEKYDFMDEDAFTIMTMGRADDVKGYWHLIKAFSLVQATIPKCRLVLIGDGDYSEYKQLAKDLGVEESVTFTGLQLNPFAYLRYGNLYLLTSESEGFPNALIEAMAVGLPVMSTNCKSGPAEIIAEHYEAVCDSSKVYYEAYGILLPSISGGKNLDTIITDEDRQIADEIYRFYKSKEMQEHYINQSQKRAKVFSNDKYVQNFMGMV